MGVTVAKWRWLVSGLEFLRVVSGSGSRGKEVEPERFGEVSGDALSPHAVACRVKRRGEGAEASLARRHGHDASGDPAFTGQAHVVEPLARMLVEPGRG